MFEKELTDEEATELYRLLNKLDEEMNSRLQEGDGAFDTGDVSYTTIIRNKRRRYLENVYDVDLGDSD